MPEGLCNELTEIKPAPLGKYVDGAARKSVAIGHSSRVGLAATGYFDRFL